MTTLIAPTAAVDPAADPALRLLLTAAVLVNDASLAAEPDGLHLTGDPTETALLVAALKAGIEPGTLRREWPRRREIPFDPARRMMASFHDTPDDGQAVFVKGAPGVVLDLCQHRQTALGPVPLAEADRLATARRIRNPVDSRNAIDDAFDDITYNKGEEVLSMFEAWLGYMGEDRPGSTRRPRAAVAEAGA